MNKRSILFKGFSHSLVGSEPEVGDSLPNFDILLFNRGDSEVTYIKSEELRSHALPILISVAASVDTPLGSQQIKTFNSLLKDFTHSSLLWSVTSDLPFAINRFFEQENIDHLMGGTDFPSHSFGKSLGVLIKNVDLLARSVFVYDRHGILRHLQIPVETQSELDYSAAVQALSKAVKA